MRESGACAGRSGSPSLPGFQVRNIAVAGWTGMVTWPASGLAMMISPSSRMLWSAVASFGLRTISLTQTTEPIAAARPILPSRTAERVPPRPSGSSTTVPIISSIELSGRMLTSA